MQETIKKIKFYQLFTMTELVGQESRKKLLQAVAFDRNSS